jgi:hypothetical protein
MGLDNQSSMGAVSGSGGSISGLGGATAAEGMDPGPVSLLTDGATARSIASPPAPTHFTAPTQLSSHLSPGRHCPPQGARSQRPETWLQAVPGVQGP